MIVTIVEVLLLCWRARRPDEDKEEMTINGKEKKRDGMTPLSKMDIYILLIRWMILQKFRIRRFASIRAELYTNKGKKSQEERVRESTSLL